ncbi:MAG: ftsH2 1 [Variovorax sp.]|nr:ftsH2 1 [Variovorax sp.]
MSLSNRLSEYIAAAFTGIWIQSHEHPEALTEIAGLCRDRQWALASWDIDRGLLVAGQLAPGTNDPLAAIRSLSGMAGPGENASSLLVLPNFHRFLSSAEIVQAMAHQIQHGKISRTFIVVLSPLVRIPVELDKHFVLLEHALPDRMQIEQIARGIATQEGDLPAEDRELDRLLDAAAGLTRFEAEGAFSLSLARHGTLVPQTVWELKEGMLRKSGLLTLHRGSETFADLGGLASIKSFCARVLAGRNPNARPRGILLLSPPGCGKSAFAKALGKETGRPTLVLDIGTLMGSLVGITEERTRQALRIADAMSPCVLFIDELEKALSGAASGSSGDSGVSSRLLGTLLSWLSDHLSDVFVVATANDISRLPPELARAERFDGVFFLDLPSSAEKQTIWPIHRLRFGIDPADKTPDDRDWTGAEIAACCRLAALLDVPLKEAAKNIVPVAVTASESVEKLRTWAAGRCLDASRPGVYTRGAAAPAPRRIGSSSAN